MKEQKEIHIGSLIKEKMEERGLSVSDFAHALPRRYSITIEADKEDIEEIRKWLLEKRRE